jgi:hypothetical protein
MGYKAYPIINMRLGKKTDLEPWLLPKDAFDTLNNCHLKHGVLEKRRGYTLLAQMVKVDTSTKNPTLQTNPVTGIFNHVDGATEYLMAADKLRINEYVNSRTRNIAISSIADAGGGDVTVTTSTAHELSVDDIITQSGCADSNYNSTFKVKTAPTTTTYTITATWGSTDTGTVDQEPFLDMTRLCIRFENTAQAWTSPGAGDIVEGATSGAYGEIEEVIIDYGTFGGTNAHGTIVLKNGTVTGTFDESAEQIFERGTPANIVGNCLATPADLAFSGGNDNWLWAKSWNLLGADWTFATNDYAGDGIRKYNGSNWSQLAIDIGTDASRAGANDVGRARIILVDHERLIIFNTQESGTDYLQRARYSSIKDFQSWPTNNFKDAPTSDTIVTAGIVNGIIYVWFEKSTWRFRYMADSANPYEWERVSEDEGAVARMSLVTHEQFQTAIGTTRVQACDGVSVKAADVSNPDIVLGWTQDSLSYCQGLLFKDERHIWEGYASFDASANADGNTYPDKVLGINYEDGSMFTYDLPVHCFGVSAVESSLTWNDVTDAWEDIDWAWNAGQAESGFPMALMGSQDGKVYELNKAGSDAGSAIEFEAIGGRWNPYIEEGFQADLGWLDFLVDVDASVTFDVLSYVDTDTDEFQTETVTCTAVGAAEGKSWHRVHVGAIANFHRIKITNNASTNRPRIHAIVPYFQKAGSALIG